MAASEAIIAQGEDPPTTASPVAAAPRWPQLIPIAQLVAVVLAVLAIIWNQQQTTDGLRTELTADISRVETTLTADISRVETGLDELRTEVANIGQRLARIEGFLGIGIPDDPPGMNPT